MFWRQCHHSWPPTLKLQKLSEKSVQCFTQTEVTLSLPHLHSTSPQDPGLSEIPGIAHTAHMVCKWGNHWAITKNAASVTTCCPLSRSCWPGCIQPCTGQFSNNKHPTHIPATWLKTGLLRSSQKPLLISKGFSPVAPYAPTILLERLRDLTWKMLFSSQTKQWGDKDKNSQTNTNFAIRR